MSDYVEYRSEIHCLRCHLYVFQSDLHSSNLYEKAIYPECTKEMELNVSIEKKAMDLNENLS